MLWDYQMWINWSLSLNDYLCVFCVQSTFSHWVLLWPFRGEPARDVGGRFCHIWEQKVSWHWCLHVSRFSGFSLSFIRKNCIPELLAPSMKMRMFSYVKKNNAYMSVCVCECINVCMCMYISAFGKDIRGNYGPFCFASLSLSWFKHQTLAL